MQGESQDHIRRRQLQELAILNSTFTEESPGPSASVSSLNTIGMKRAKMGCWEMENGSSWYSLRWFWASNRKHRLTVFVVNCRYAQFLGLFFPLNLLQFVWLLLSCYISKGQIQQKRGGKKKKNEKKKGSWGCICCSLVLCIAEVSFACNCRRIFFGFILVIDTIQLYWIYICVCTLPRVVISRSFCSLKSALGSL